MKSEALFAFFSIIVVALAGPLGTIHNASRHRALQNQMHTYQIDQENFVRPVQPRDTLTDLIDAITGSDVGTLIGRIDTVVADLDKLVKEAESELGNILESVDPAVQERIQEVIDNALVQAQTILEPILAQLKKLMPAITNLSPNDISTIIIALLGKTLEEFLRDIKSVLEGINELLKETTQKLQGIAESVSESIAEKILTLIENTLRKGEAAIKPLTDVFSQLFSDNDVPKITSLRHSQALRLDILGQLVKSSSRLRIH